LFVIHQTSVHFDAQRSSVTFFTVH